MTRATWWLTLLLACSATDGATTGSATGSTSGPDTTDTTAAAGASTSGAADTSATSGTSSGTDASTSSTSGADGSSTSTAGATCPDVEFVYSVAYDPDPGNDCDSVLGMTNTCSVTQTDCQLSWMCNGAFENLLLPGPIDADGLYTSEGTFMGVPVTCMVMFTTDPYAFEFACAGTEIDCSGGGF